MTKAKLVTPSNLTKKDLMQIERWKIYGFIDTRYHILSKHIDLYHGIMNLDIPDTYKKDQLITLKQFMKANQKQEFSQKVHGQIKDIIHQQKIMKSSNEKNF